MKTFRLFSMAALALAMAACSNNDDNEIQQNTQQPGTMHFTATIAAPSGDATTRTVYTEDGTTINVKWKVGDQIALVYNSKKDVATVTAVDGSGNATIEATITGGPSDDDDVTLAYPANAVYSTTPYYGLPFTPNPTTTFDKVKDQDGTLEFIQDNLDLRMGSGKLAVSGSDVSLKGSVSVSSLICIWKLTLQDNASTPLSATELTFKNNTATQAKATSAAKSVYYLCVVPSFIPDASGTFSFEATVGSDTYTFSKTGLTLAAGNYYQSTVKMTKATVDLSMVDCAGNARSTMSTANCYMVHTAGYYKLPLVYGNAIKNGAANATAYTGVSGTNTTATFPNHAGNAINAPWITKSTSGEGVDKGMGIVVASAELLWQDAEGLITAVGISGDYLTLTVGKNATAQQGNAVVAAKDGSGNIVWSWHIWVTTETFGTLTTVATGSHNYSVTPVNLGWVPTGGEGKQGYNTYYQWGRKDAFIPGTWNATTNHAVYNISNTPVTGLTYTPSTTAAIADNIKNPTTHYYNSSTSGPCTSKYYNMWDAQQTGTGNIASATKKTVYDPCPAGFCVPTGNLYYFMGNTDKRTMGTWDTTNKGATWDNNVVSGSITGNALFFPASGCRLSSSGTLHNVGSHGYYWSASPDDGSNGRTLHSYSSFWVWFFVDRAYGFPVRAVAEE